MIPVKSDKARAKTRRIIVRNRDTGELVKRYETMSAAQAHVRHFPNDYIAGARS